MNSFIHTIFHSKWAEWIYLGVVLTFFSFLYLHVNTQGTFILQDYRQGSYYSQLGLQFIKGSLGLNDMIGGDWALFGGKYYLYHGPLPALIWLFFRTYFLEISLSLLALITLTINLLLFYLICRRVSFLANFDENGARAVRFIALICYGLGIPYYLAGKLFVYEISIIFGSTFLLGAFLLFLRYLVGETAKQRSLIRTGCELFGVGILISFAFLSRINLLLAFLPFIGAFAWKEWNFNKEKVRNWVQSWFLFTCFIFPIALSLLCFGFYNVARFGNPVDFGVKHLITSSDDDNMRLSSGKATSIHYALLNVMQATILLPFFDTKPSYINYTAPSWLVGPFPRLVNVEYGGSLFFSNPLLLFIFLIPFFWKKLTHAVRVIIVFSLGLFLSVGTYSYFFMGFSRRYHQDYYPILLLFSFIGMYLFCKYCVSRFSAPGRYFFWGLVGVTLIWIAVIAVQLNCIHTYYGQFDRCLDLYQPIQWFQPLS